MVAASRARSLGITIAVALALPLTAWFLFGDRNLNLADEGYLWYGVLRTVAGEVPLRDFQAYDPGRYHWCALFSPLLGTGILGIRAAVAVYHALGLLAGLLVLRRVATHWSAQLLFGLVLELWMFPRHKLFEPGTALMATWFAVRLLERPSVARHLAAGAFVGFAGYMGRNLGLYSGLSMGALALVSAWKRREPGTGRDLARRLGALAGGVVLGYTPSWILLLFAPGYARALADSVRFLAEQGPNLPHAWPWPWTIDTTGADFLGFVDAWAESLAYLLPIVVIPILLVHLARTRATELPARSACLASGVVALGFLHHASVRSDAVHLAQCIPPLLLALLAAPLLARRPRKVAALVWSGLALLTLAVARTSNPTLTTTLGRDFVEQDVAGERLRLLPGQAAYLAALEQVVARHVGDDALFVAPNRPTLYPLLGKSAPTWWIYFLWPSPDAIQQGVIADLVAHDVRWALIIDAPTENREDLLFRNTNPLIWRFFTDGWQRVPVPEWPADHVLLRRR